MSANEILSFEDYKKNRYEKLESDFLNKSARNLKENLTAIRKIFLEELRKAILSACEVQTSENKNCAYISISFLNSAMFEDNPTLQIDFYDEGWFYGESFSRSRFKADFLLKDWQKFIFDALDDNFYVRSKISKVEIKSLFWATLDKLIYIFASYTKYFADRVTYYNEFDELLKAEKFYITCGTYLDWQERIFAQLPEIDLLNLDANEETTFRPINKKIFREKNFSDLNLRNCYFEDCIFDRFTFAEIILADAQFLRCKFTNTKFIGSKFAGAIFSECYFKDCEFQNCSANPADISEDEYFANFRIYRCYLLNINFSDCKFANLEKINCFEK